MIHMTLPDLIGVLGAFCYLTGFALQQLQRIDGRGAVFALSKLMGGSLMLLSLSYAFNLGAALIQVAWIVVAIVTLGRIAHKTSHRFHTKGRQIHSHRRRKVRQS